jgi:hypothetical protein
LPSPSSDAPEIAQRCTGRLHWHGAANPTGKRKSRKVKTGGALLTFKTDWETFLHGNAREADFIWSIPMNYRSGSRERQIPPSRATAESQ